MPYINEQPSQVVEQMTTQPATVESSQPTSAPQMSTSGDSVGIRGGEEAGCNCCCCGCEESCC